MNCPETDKEFTKTKTPRRKAQCTITLESSPRTLVPNLLVPSHLTKISFDNVTLEDRQTDQQTNF